MAESGTAMQMLSAAQAAAVERDWQAVRSACARCIGELQPLGSSPGIAVRALLLQAEAAHHLKDAEGALQALDLAVQLQPTCSKALWQRAAVQAGRGYHMASFMDLRTLSHHDPGFPGLPAALQAAAAAVAQQQATQTQAKAPPKKTYIRTTRRTKAHTSTAAADACSTPLHGAYSVLGVQPGAAVQEVRRVYKQLAQQWHPDKWGQAGAVLQAEAEERFKQVSAAYQTIMEQVHDQPSQP